MQPQLLTLDFFYSQIRSAFIAVMAYGAGAKWFTPEAAGLYTTLFASFGPMAIPLVFSFFSNLGTLRVPTNSSAAVVAAVEKVDPVSANTAAGIAVTENAQNVNAPTAKV